MTQKEQNATEELIKGMSDEEMKIVVKCIPDTTLWQELIDRYYSRSHLGTAIKNLAKDI